jgi:hypothetical protein
MKEHTVEEHKAKQLLLRIVVQKENKALGIRQDISEEPHSQEVVSCAALDLFIGGSCYWYATASCYQSAE